MLPTTISAPSAATVTGKENATMEHNKPWDASSEECVPTCALSRISLTYGSGDHVCADHRVGKQTNKSAYVQSAIL
jgi:hypothetical protein